jgi:hypothetical protein
MALHFEGALRRAFKHTIKYLNKLDQVEISATAPYRELHSRFSQPLSAEGIEPIEVMIN